MLNQLRDVFSSLRKHDVKYLTIGGIAAVLYGVPRATFDLDILIETSTPGIRFEDAWENRETMTYQGYAFYVLSRTDLIASKRAAGREVDLQDVRLLELADEEE
jgi:hypothetical protein